MAHCCKRGVYCQDSQVWIVTVWVTGAVRVVRINPIRICRSVSKHSVCKMVIFIRDTYNVCTCITLWICVLTLCSYGFALDIQIQNCFILVPVVPVIVLLFLISTLIGWWQISSDRIMAGSNKTLLYPTKQDLYKWMYECLNPEYKIYVIRWQGRKEGRKYVIKFLLKMVIWD